MSVGLDIARIPLEHLADGGAGVLGLVLEEDVVAVGQHHEEVPSPTRLMFALDGLGLHRYAGGVGRQAEGRCLGVGGHRLDNRSQRRPCVLSVTAHRATIERGPLEGHARLLSVEGHAQQVLADQQVRHQRWRQHPPAKEQLGRLDLDELEPRGRPGAGGLRSVRRGYLERGRLDSGGGQLVRRIRHHQTTMPTALVAQQRLLLEADAFSLALQLVIENLDALDGQLGQLQVSSSRGLGLGLVLGVVLALGVSLPLFVECLAETFHLGKQGVERQLFFCDRDTLGLGDEEPAA
ncbi:MAG: hypothetical protein MUF64_24190 [Polyangiaceae bacterium]|nr:hypothetical protein [Polyangiaceae bacterium]